MATVQKLVAVGEKMGLKADSLQNFVREQQALIRDERQKEREKQETERAFEKEKFEQELELQKRKSEIEYELALEREKIGKMKLELKSKELEKLGHAKADIESDHSSANTDDESSSTSSKGSKHRSKGPKITAFDERDDIDSYLRRFERYAEVQHWDKSEWAIYLASLLKGKALVV